MNKSYEQVHSFQNYTLPKVLNLFLKLHVFKIISFL